MEIDVKDFALRYAVLDEARTWIGTPFRHQARVKGEGCDCTNLVIGVGLEVRTPQGPPVFPINMKRLKRVWTPFYGRRPDPPTMRDAFVDLGLVPIRPMDVDVGDLAWMHWGDHFPIHMAIIGEHDGYQTAVHAIYDFQVAEQPTNQFFLDRVTEYFRYPGIAEAES